MVWSLVVFGNTCFHASSTLPQLTWEREKGSPVDYWKWGPKGGHVDFGRVWGICELSDEDKQGQNKNLRIGLWSTVYHTYIGIIP